MATGKLHRIKQYTLDELNRLVPAPMSVNDKIMFVLWQLKRSEQNKPMENKPLP